jgi:hypothetical protein
MPCTTTDPAESQGNVRQRPLSDIWANGFGAFRSRGNGIKSDCSDCWLQTRHDHSCRPAFFLDLFAREDEAGRKLVPLCTASVGGVA